MITSRVKKAPTAADILAVMQSEQSNPELNMISVSAAWCRLAQLQRSFTAEVSSSASFATFVALTQSFLEKPEAREVANTLWAAARLQSRASAQLATLWASLALAVQTTAKHMNEQDVANSMWSVAKLATTDADIDALLGTLPTLASRVPVITSAMKAQEVANILWAVAKLATTGQDKALLSLPPSLASRIPAVVREMIAQHVSNVIWATGQLSVDPNHAASSKGLRKVLPILMDQAMVVLPSATPQALANSCRGLALSDHQDAAFLQAVAEKVAREAANWQRAGAQKDLPEVLFAFARLKVTGHHEMLDAAAKKLTPTLARISKWGLCALTWSYRQLDTGDNFMAFQQSLDLEVERRQLSDEDVERSRLGPEAW